MFMVHKPTTPRERRRRANHQRILDTAEAIVVSEGFSALSIHRVARDTDYTPGALYRYFRSKDALIAALATRVIESLDASVQQASGAVPPDQPLARAATSLLTYRRFASEHPHRFGLLSLILAEPRMLVVDAEEASTSIHAAQVALSAVQQSLAAAEAIGTLSPGQSAERAVMAFASVHGLLQLRKHQGRLHAVTDLDLLVANIVRSLFVGWGAAPDRVDAAMRLARNAVSGASS